MSAIITDQLRILNSENFVAGIASTTNSYYAWIGLPNPADFQSDWSENPPSPTTGLGKGGDGATSSINSTPTARAGGGGGGTSETFADDAQSQDHQSFHTAKYLHAVRHRTR